MIYASKKMHDFDYDNHFVIGVRIENNHYSSLYALCLPIEICD